MYKNSFVSAILLMGGTGARFGSSVPKQFHRLAGKKVYLHTLDIFLASEFIDEIILCCPKDWTKQVQDEVKNPSIKVIDGGNTRQESSCLALLACNPLTHSVVIHDAVRPFVSQKIIVENIQAAYLYKAVDTCIPSADTIVHTQDGLKITTIPNRNQYLRGQTPQSFNYDLILKVHKQTLQNNTSDDCRLVIEAGHPVHIVDGSEDNIKITTELDIFLAEQIYRQRKHQVFFPSVENSLENKRYAVVGGTGGIGKCVCSLLEKEKALPITLSRSQPNFSCDLTNPRMIKEVFKKIHSHYGPLDGLINAAGLLKIKPFDQLNLKEIEELLMVNFTGLLHTCKAAKIKKGGHIINIASSSFSRGRKDYGIYSSAKAAVVNFTQSLAEEREDCHINVIIPQRTNTLMRRTNFPDEDCTDLLSPELIAQEIIKVLKTDHLSGTIIEVRL